MDKDDNGGQDNDDKEKKTNSPIDKLAARVLDFDLNMLKSVSKVRRIDQ